MLLPTGLYEKVMLRESSQQPLFSEESLGKPILQMPDFNSLIARSQEHKAPIFELTDAQLEHAGEVLEQTKKSMHQFQKLYSDGVDRIITLVENA